MLTPRNCPFSSIYCVALLSLFIICLAGCNDVSQAPPAPTTPAGPGPLAIVSSALPDGTVNLPYAATLGGSGGVTTYNWTVSPALPADLALDPQAGTITGTPAAAGTSTHTFTLTDSSSPQQSVQKILSLTINPPSAVLAITTTSLPSGQVGQAYNQTLHASGGSGPLTWSIISGTLPQNLTLNAGTGVISGTPTAPGTSSFTVHVADTTGQADTQALSIVVNPAGPPVITTTTLPGGTVGIPYSQTLAATGGTGALVWSRTAGSLPTNLTLSSAGVISGTPTNTGTSNFTVRVTDALSQSDTQALSIVISAALTITTTSLPNAKVGKSYNETLQRSGGLSPFTWSVSPALPSGLNLNASSGAITGTPASGTAKTYTLTFTVQDSSTPKQSANKQINLTVTP